ncbi:MAG: GNAT family N-acetyltransferase [Proteobacteria bacterium]|nr:GNAT family N-acetyltransferase [Pseudomonadota bacterium]
MVKIREASLDDCITIAALHAKSWQRAYKGILSDQYLDHEVESDRLQIWMGRFANPSVNQLILCLESAQDIVGFVCAYFSADEAFGTFIDNLHVSHALKRHGYGAQMVERIADLSRAQFNESRVYLWVLADNKPAVTFYERIGGERYEARIWDSPDGGKYLKYRYVWGRQR